MRGARCDRSGHKSGEGSAGPEPKIATVERREASVPRTRDARRLTSAWRAPLSTPNGCFARAPYVSRCSAHPSFRVSEAKNKTRARKTRRGTERCCLVISLSVRHSGRGAIAARAGIHNHWPGIWNPGSRASPAPRNDAEKTRITVSCFRHSRTQQIVEVHDAHRPYAIDQDQMCIV